MIARQWFPKGEGFGAACEESLEGVPQEAVAPLHDIVYRQRTGNLLREAA